MTTLDASFLEVESPSAHMHVGWAAVFAPPGSSRRPTFEELRDHVAGRLSRAPRYRQKLARVPLGVSAPMWVDDERFDVDRHVRRARSTDLSEITDEVMSAQLQRDRPLWELWIADRLSDGRIGVVGKAHHAMADGLAAVELAALLLDPSPEPPPRESDGWRPAPHPGALSLLLEGVSDRAGTALDVATLPVRLALRPRQLAGLPGHGLRGARALLDSVRPAPSQTAINDPISSRRHLARARRPLADLKRIKLRFGTTINDVVLAVAAGGVRRFAQRRGDRPIRLKAMVPVSVRSEHGPSELGNRISFVFVDLPCDEPDPLRRLMRIKEAVGERKRTGGPEGADEVLKAFAYAPRTVQKLLSRLVASPRTFNLVVSNIPGPPGPLYMLGCELDEVYPVVPLADRHALSIGLTTIADDAFFGVCADRDSLPDSDVLAECISESVDELLTLGGE